MHKLLHPSADIADPNSEHPFYIHPMLTQYLFPPDEVMDASSSAAEALGKAAKLSLIPPKPKFAKGKGAKTKAARKLKGSAVADLFGTSTGEGEDVEEVDVATVDSQAVTAAAGFGQSQNLYRQSANASFSKSAFAQSQAQGRASSSPAAKQSNGSAANGNKGKSAAKQKKRHAGTDEEDGSATEESDAEDSMQLDDQEPTAPPGASIEEGRDRDRDSLISLKTPIEDFEKLVEQGGHMTSTAFKQCKLRIVAGSAA